METSALVMENKIFPNKILNLFFLMYLDCLTSCESCSDSSSCDECIDPISRSGP